MNIILNLDNLLKSDETNQLISVKILITHNKISSEYKGIFKSTDINLKTDIEFAENEKYSIVFSIVILGKQIVKEKYSFVYKENLSYQIKDGKINLKIMNKNMENSIKPIFNITYRTYNNYNFKINPLAIIRKEDDNKETIFFSDNVYIIRDKLMEIINKIHYNNKFKEDIEKYKKIESINLLISKGCIICYE
ncbi:MAG: hypothetical protein IKF83_02875 [Clostridia bacterium]|nr:hypothetical protein [Clostridia bacterium]